MPSGYAQSVPSSFSEPAMSCSNISQCCCTTQGSTRARKARLQKASKSYTSASKNAQKRTNASRKEETDHALQRRIKGSCSAQSAVGDRVTFLIKCVISKFTRQGAPLRGCLCRGSEWERHMQRRGDMSASSAGIHRAGAQQRCSLCPDLIGDGSMWVDVGSP